MTVTTDEEWEVNGVSLNTLAWNISTLTGREALPPIRGENVVVPGRPGQLWTPKQFDAKPLTLAMWVQGCDDDGELPEDRSRRHMVMGNLEALKQTFGRRDRPLVLDRKVRTMDWVTNEPVLSARWTYAETVGVMEPTFQAGATRATFVVDLLMPEPFWYGADYVEVNGGYPTVTYDGGPLQFPIGGSTTSYRLLLEFVGPLTNPQLTNIELGLSVAVSGTIDEGETITLNVWEFTAVNDNGDSVIGRVSHSGGAFWMALDPYYNELLLDDGNGGDPGDGEVVVKAYSAWL